MIYVRYIHFVYFDLSVVALTFIILSMLFSETVRCRKLKLGRNIGGGGGGGGGGWGVGGGGGVGCRCGIS